MIRHAVEEYPEECCGLLLHALSVSKTTLEWQPCHNVQNVMHQLEPHHFPRDARSAYIIDPDEWRSIHPRIEAGEIEVSVLYHSHNDAPACFSDEYHKRAVWLEQPLFPHATYLVLSVMQGELDHWKAFKWDPDAGQFLEVGCGRATDEDAHWSS